MISIKTPAEQEKMRKACKMAAQALEHTAKFVSIGISTEELNNICHEYILHNGGIPAPLNYEGFPKSICTSINDVVCHGIPSPKDILKNGDIINLDITVILDGYHGDLSKTYLVGEVAEPVKLLVERAEKAMLRGIEAVKPGSYLYEVGKAIENYVHKFGYGIVSEYGGHGIGKHFHEDPHVYHFYTPANRIRMKPGMTFTVEPMINMGGSPSVVTSQKDKWTVTTKDRSLSAQFEHTILVTDKGVEILTLP